MVLPPGVHVYVVQHHVTTLQKQQQIGLKGLNEGGEEKQNKCCFFVVIEGVIHFNGKPDTAYSVSVSFTTSGFQSIQHLKCTLMVKLR